MEDIQQVFEKLSEKFASTSDTDTQTLLLDEICKMIYKLEQSDREYAFYALFHSQFQEGLLKFIESKTDHGSAVEQSFCILADILGLKTNDKYMFRAEFYEACLTHIIPFCNVEVKPHFIRFLAKALETQVHACPTVRPYAKKLVDHVLLFLNTCIDADGSSEKTRICAILAFLAGVYENTYLYMGEIHLRRIFKITNKCADILRNASEEELLASALDFLSRVFKVSCKYNMQEKPFQELILSGQLTIVSKFLNEGVHASACDVGIILVERAVSVVRYLLQWSRGDNPMIEVIIPYVPMLLRSENNSVIAQTLRLLSENVYHTEIAENVLQCTQLSLVMNHFMSHSDDAVRSAALGLASARLNRCQSRDKPRELYRLVVNENFVASLVENFKMLPEIMEEEDTEDYEIIIEMLQELTPVEWTTEPGTWLLKSSYKYALDNQLCSTNNASICCKDDDLLERIQRVEEELQELMGRLESVSIEESSENDSENDSEYSDVSDIEGSSQHYSSSNDSEKDCKSDVERDDSENSQ